MGNFPDSADSRLSNSLDFSTLGRLSKATFDSRATFDSLDFGDFPDSGDSPHVGGSPFVVSRSPCRRDPVPAPDRPRSPVAAFPWEWVQIYPRAPFRPLWGVYGRFRGSHGRALVVRAQCVRVEWPTMRQIWRVLRFMVFMVLSVPLHNKARYGAIFGLYGGRAEHRHKKTPPRRAGCGGSIVVNRDFSVSDKYGGIGDDDAGNLLFISRYAMQGGGDVCAGVGVAVVHAGVKLPAEKLPVFLFRDSERLPVRCPGRGIPAQIIRNFHVCASFHPSTARSRTRASQPAALHRSGRRWRRSASRGASWSGYIMRSPPR